MRLSQLAKSLEVQVSDIVLFLENRQIVPKSTHPNAKLEEAHQELVIAHFENADSKEDEYVPNITTKESADGVEEVITAPKVELPGLKVVGKIELPEKKEPEVKEEENESDESQSEEESKDPSEIQMIRHSKRNSRKKLTKEEREARRLKSKKARERRLAEEQKRKEEAELEAIKKRKEAHYKKKLQQKKVANQKQLQPQRVNKKTANNNQEERPKSALKRFWIWLNT